MSRDRQMSYNKRKTTSHLISSVYLQNEPLWIVAAARLTLHPNMSDRVRLLQMTLHWHMTGERHLKFLTGRDISPESHSRQNRLQLVGPPPPIQSHVNAGSRGEVVGEGVRSVKRDRSGTLVPVHAASDHVCHV